MGAGAYIEAVMLAAAFFGLAAYIVLRPSLPPLMWLLGPVAIDILTGCYAIVAALFSRPGDDWLIAPVLAALVVVLIWHIALIVRGPARTVVSAYGVAHVSFWLPFALACMFRISKDSL
jgi:hypothetical protein